MCVVNKKKPSFNSKVYIQFYGPLLFPKKQPKLIRAMKTLLRHIQDGQQWDERQNRGNSIILVGFLETTQPEVQAPGDCSQH